MPQPHAPFSHDSALSGLDGHITPRRGTHLRPAVASLPLGPWQNNDRSIFVHHLPSRKKPLALWEWQRARWRPLPPQKVLLELYHDPAHPPQPPERTPVVVQERVVDVQRRPGERVGRLGEVVDLLVSCGSSLGPLGEDTAVLGDGAVELGVGVLFPGLLLHDLGCVELLGVKLLTEVELACDELVGCEDGELDIVAVGLVLELVVVLLVTLPTELGCGVEVEELDVVRDGVDEQVPRANVPVDDPQFKVEVINNLENLVSRNRRGW